MSCLRLDFLYKLSPTFIECTCLKRVSFLELVFFKHKSMNELPPSGNHCVSPGFTTTFTLPSPLPHPHLLILDGCNKWVKQIQCMLMFCEGQCQIACAGSRPKREKRKVETTTRMRTVALPIRAFFADDKVFTRTGACPNRGSVWEQEKGSSVL